MLIDHIRKICLDFTLRSYAHKIYVKWMCLITNSFFLLLRMCLCVCKSMFFPLSISIAICLINVENTLTMCVYVYDI